MPGSAVVGTPLATVVLVTPTPAPVIQPTGPTFGYVVKSGDTLFSIALAYSTDVDRTIQRITVRIRSRVVISFIRRVRLLRSGIFIVREY